MPKCDFNKVIPKPPINLSAVIPLKSSLDRHCKLCNFPLKNPYLRKTFTKEILNRKLHFLAQCSYNIFRCSLTNQFKI